MLLKNKINTLGSLVLLSLLFTATSFAQNILLEAEMFSDLGGWDLDQQSMEQMGSPYLLAHGLGVPVKDATTSVKFSTPGDYRVWVRTRDWVARWKVPGAPGRFQVLVDGKPLATEFGTVGAEWAWHDGGKVTVGNQAMVALHDLTGFEGRCDAILFAKDLSFHPPNELGDLAAFRNQALGIAAEPNHGGEFDLVVIGGGIAGTSAAVSAARNGLSVALIQDRPVLGGNGSSEVRVWPEGHTKQKPYTHIGEIVDEICPPRGSGTGNAKGGAIYQDERKLRVVQAEPRIKLFLEERVNAVKMKGNKIVSVTSQNIRSSQRTIFLGKLFADCTGDATVGFLAGADYEVSQSGNMGASNLWNVLDQSQKEQVLKCECKDKDALSMLAEAGEVAAPFPRLTWALDLTHKSFRGVAVRTVNGRTRRSITLAAGFGKAVLTRIPSRTLSRYGTSTCAPCMVLGMR